MASTQTSKPKDPAVEAVAEAIGRTNIDELDDDQIAEVVVETLGIEQIGWHRADTGVFSAMGGDFDYDYWQPVYRLKALEEEEK